MGASGSGSWWIKATAPPANEAGGRTWGRGISGEGGTLGGPGWRWMKSAP